MKNVKVQAEVPGKSPQLLVMDKLCLTGEDVMQVLSLGRNSIYPSFVRSGKRIIGRSVRNGSRTSKCIFSQPITENTFPSRVPDLTDQGHMRLS